MTLLRLFLLISVLNTPNVYAFLNNLTVPESNIRNTEDFLKEKRDVAKVKVLTSLNDLNKCKFIKEITSHKKLEYWEYKNSCEIVIKELKGLALSNGGNALLLNPSMKCSEPEYKVRVYKC